MRIGLLSVQVFSPFVELWFAGSHGGGGIFLSGAVAAVGIQPRNTYHPWAHAAALGGAFGIGGGVVAEGRMVGFVSCKPDAMLHLLTHYSHHYNVFLLYLYCRRTFLLTCISAFHRISTAQNRLVASSFRA